MYVPRLDWLAQARPNVNLNLVMLMTSQYDDLTRNTLVESPIGTYKGLTCNAWRRATTGAIAVGGIASRTPPNRSSSVKSKHARTKLLTKLADWSLHLTNRPQMAHPLSPLLLLTNHSLSPTSTLGAQPVRARTLPRWPLSALLRWMASSRVAKRR